MSSGTKSTAQLRVRLSNDDMEFLLQLAQKQPGKANVSKVIKELIGNARHGAYTLPLKSEAKYKLESMADLLDRTPELVVHEALDAMQSLSESDDPPLLVMELKLVKSCLKKRAFQRRK